MVASRTPAVTSDDDTAAPASPYAEMLLRRPRPAPKATAAGAESSSPSSRWREEPLLEDADAEIQPLPPGPNLERHLPAPPIVEPASAAPEEPPLEAPPEMEEQLAELPAEDSLLERFDPARAQRRFWWNRWRETPCWLTSLVLHLAVLVLLGALLFPESPRHMRNWLQVMMLSEPTPERAVIEVATSPTAQPTVEEHVLDMPRPTEDPEPEPAEEEAPPEEAPEPAAGEPEEEPATADPAPVEEAAANPQFVVQSAPLEPIDPARLARGPNDDVVSRFIEYDLGQLTGDDAVRARNDFSELGPDSIPALVRGLNRSASIHASCPVMVLAQKLSQSISQSDDPQMIRYALEHIGQGVPSTAPHRKRLDSLAARLRTQFMVPQDLARDLLVSRGVQPRPELVESMVALGSASPLGLIAALGESENEALQLAATLEITLRPTGFAHDAQRVDLAEGLIPLLTSLNPEQSSHAHLALCCLAGGDMSKQASPGESRQEFWSGWWAAFDQERVVGPRVHALMRMAESLESAGRFDAAERRYREVISEYPGTLAAQKAEQILGGRTEYSGAFE